MRAPGLFGSKRSESRNSLSRGFSCVRLARHPKPIFVRLAAFEDRPSKCHRARDTAIFINEPNPTEAQRNRRFFNSLPFAGTRFNGASKSLEKHWLPLVFPHVYLVTPQKTKPSAATARIISPPKRSSFCRKDWHSCGRVAMLNGCHIWNRRLGKELMCNLYSITTNQAVSLEASAVQPTLARTERKSASPSAR